MTTTTAASPPPASAGDQWFDTTQGNRRCECTAVISWDAGTGFAGWTASNAAAAVTASWPDGSQALTVTASGAGNWLATSPAQAVSPGDIIDAITMLYSPAATLNQVSLGIAWLDGSGALLSATAGAAASLAAGATGVRTVTGSAPAGAASFTLRPGDAEASAAGTQMVAGNASAAHWVPYPAAAAAMSLPITGAVDNTTVAGARVVAYGTSGEVLIYSGTPALGNLVASISSFNGADSSGNAFLGGVAAYTYGTGGSNWHAITSNYGGLSFYKATGPAGPWSLYGNLEPFGTSTDDLCLSSDTRAVLSAPQAVVGGTGYTGALTTQLMEVQGNAAISGQWQAIVSGAVETWHSLSPGNGWTGSFSYMLTPQNEVAISCSLTAPAASPDGVTIVTLPAGYRPATGPKVIPIGASGVTGSVAPYFTVSTGGAVQARGVAVSAATVGTNAKITLGL